MSTGHWWNDTESKGTKCFEQTVSQSCIHRFAGLAVNPAFRGEIPVTSRLNHGRTRILVRFPVAARDFFFYSPKPPEQLWGPQFLIFSGYRGPFRGIKRTIWKLIVSLHLMPRFPIRGTMPTIPPYAFV
jgi:hypothetical protein